MSASDGSGGVYEDLKWKAVLCCELPFAQTLDDGLSEHPPVGQCQLLNATKPEFSSKSPTLSGKINLCDIKIIAFGMTFSKSLDSSFQNKRKAIYDSLAILRSQKSSYVCICIRLPYLLGEEVLARAVN